MSPPAKSSTSIRIVLSHVRNPLNIGAAARAMANFGLRDLVLVEPYSEAWKQAKSARGGAKVLQTARVVATLPEALEGCRHVVGTTAGAKRVPEMPLEDWADVAASLPSLPTAIVFGSERTGLGIDEISHCDRLARINTRKDAPSMNLGQAVAVIGYQLSRNPPAVPAPGSPPISSDARERVLARWYPVLERIGAVRPMHRSSQTRKLRQMLIRWRLTEEDERRMLGVARELLRLLPRP